MSDHDAIEEDYLLGRRLAAVGPPVPTGSAWGPQDLAVLRTREVTQRPLLWIVGLHGGAGVSTVVDLFGADAKDGKRAWPRPPAPPAAPVLLVARTHHQGLSKVSGAAREWASGALPWVNLLGVILVDDSPKPPSRLLADQLTQVAHMTPACWRLSWHEQWRSEPASLNTANRRTRNTIRDMHDHALAAREATEPRRNTP